MKAQGPVGVLSTEAKPRGTAEPKKSALVSPLHSVKNPKLLKGIHDVQLTLLKQTTDL